MYPLVVRYRKYVLAVAGISLAAFLIIQNQRSGTELITATVDRGNVTETVSVSGTVEAKHTAHLAFPNPGVITGIFVDEGDLVPAGTLLATLGTNQLVAERTAAIARLSAASAARDTLLNGPTTESRAVTESTVAAARTALDETTQTEATKVANAHALLLSSGLTAESDSGNETATPPTISGTYTCGEEGSYTITPYRSSSVSGYSYRLSGLESGTYTLYNEQPGPLGTCGLFIQFDTGSEYSNSSWTVTVPNTRSSTYTTYLNAYELALRQQAQNVQAAADALTLATNEAERSNAAPRIEALIEANATISQAESQIAAVDAQIANQSIIAPFDGMVTSIDIVTGEIGSNAPAMTFLSGDAFTVTARIAEIDITKVAVGQTAAITFDAARTDVQTGTITYISPLATLIDGVAYFEATLVLAANPSWLRAGLNADVDITTKSATDVLRVPKRFLTTVNGSVTANVLSAKATETRTVDILFTGNDGYAAIDGLASGDVVVAP